MLICNSNVFAESRGEKRAHDRGQQKGSRHISPWHELETGCVEGGVEACVMFSPVEHGGGRCYLIGM